MRALLILGPTASGKSALAMALAARLPVEIVSVDSAQVYRGLDIGTAKPGPLERQQVPHHLIDIRDPAEPYSAARFVADAVPLIAQIRERGRLPLLVGGTMLYARALLSPFDALPAADPAIRRQLELEAAEVGWPALHRRLEQLDPASAARIKPGDQQRIQRALEVLELTGMPLSRLQSRMAPGRAVRSGGPATGEVGEAGGAGETGQAESDAGSAGAAAASLPILSLEPSDRSVLHHRIAQRFDRMLAAGLLDEVRGLMARPDLHADLPAFRSVGYRQAWQHLAGATDARTLREAGIAATRQLAKRQLTWLRALPVHHRLDCLRDDLVARASAIIETMDWQPGSRTALRRKNP
jgi:tRNA dimethylallyltransferase